MRRLKLGEDASKDFDVVLECPNENHRNGGDENRRTNQSGFVEKDKIRGSDARRSLARKAKNLDCVALRSVSTRPKLGANNF
jgi:hypothetical protein